MGRMQAPKACGQQVVINGLKVSRHPLRRGRRGSRTPKHLQRVFEQENRGGRSTDLSASADDERAVVGLTGAKVSKRWMQKQAVSLVDRVANGRKDVLGGSLDPLGPRVLEADKRIVGQNPHCTWPHRLPGTLTHQVLSAVTAPQSSLCKLQPSAGPLIGPYLPS